MSKSVKPLPIYGDFLFFRMAAAAILGFQNLKILGVGGSRQPKCVTVPNFAVIGQTVAEIWRFFDFFQDGGRTPSWICDDRVWTTTKGIWWSLSLCKICFWWEM